MTTYVTEFKSSQNVDNVSCHKYTLLCQVTKPVLLMMKIFGVYFYEPGRANDPANTEKSVSKSRFNFLKWYCVCLTVLSGLNVLRYIPSFWVGIDFVPNLTVPRIITMSWLTQCFLNRLFLLRACWLRSHLREFFQFFDEIMTDTCCVHIKQNSTRSRRYTIVFVILAWLIILLNVGTTIFNLTIQAENLVVICNPFSAKSIAIQIIIVVFHTIEMGAWIFPVVFLIALFKILCDQFTSYTNVLCKMTKDEGRNVWQKMKDIRLKHLQLCKAVDILEQDTKYLIAGNYVTNIFLICFIVYQMITSSSAIPVLGYITFCIWLFMNFSIMTSLSVTASHINEEAHSPLQYIFDVEMDEVSRSEALQIQMFLSKLNGPALGFTVMGLITITKEFILTLAGLILTYFFLLLQFNI